MGTTRKSLAIFWRANAQYPGLFFGSIGLWAIGLTLQKIIAPLITARALNDLIRLYGHSGVDYWTIFAPYILLLAVLLLAAQALNDLSLYLLSRLETKVRPELQMRIFDTLTNQSLTFHANNFAGSLVSQTNRFTGAYIALTDTLVINVMLTFVMSVVAIAVVAFFLPIMALVMTMWTAFFVWLNLKLTKRRMQYSRAAAVADSALTGHLADAVGNVSAIKAFGREHDEYATHRLKADDRAHKKYISWLVATRNDFVFGVMMAILHVSVFSLSIYATMNGTIEIGTLLLVQVYVTQLISQLWGLSSLSRNVEQSLADAAEMTEILDQPFEVTDPKKPQPLHVKKGDISFSQVTFTHDGSADALFRDFNMTVSAGEKIGLVGHSGSGKTSLTRLLLRFVDIDDGNITIDGQDISKVAQADLRQHIAYVPQEPLLFHRTLRENITYGKPDATESDLLRAATLAHADAFIRQLPQGYDTMVGERGVKLSGGQRQRIAIARAILKNAPIIVLDEATSALDSESERLIQDALKTLMKGRTTIVIAHRLSTIQHMDRIVVLQDGAIIEQGTHKQLVKKTGGTYASLWKHQSGGFLED